MPFVGQKEGGDPEVGGGWSPTYWCYYIYCGKCGSCDISWTNQNEVEQENKRILARKGREEGSCAKILTILLLMGLVIFNGYLSIDGYLNVLMRSVVYAFSVSVFLFVIYRSTTEWQWRQKIRTYKYRCEKCGFEFLHTFPKPREDNPLEYLAAFGLSFAVMPTSVWVKDETKTIHGADMRKGHTLIWDLRKVMNTWPPVTESEIRIARQRYFSEMGAYKATTKRKKLRS